MWSQLGTITTNKASGGDGIPVELFQILKHDAVKVLHSICQQIWKTQQWPQDWKMSVFIPIAKKGNARDISLTFSKPCSSLDLALNTLGTGQIIYSQWVDFLRCKTIIFALNISLSSFEDYIKIIIVQWLSCVWLFVTSWTAARQASLSITITQSSLKVCDAIQPSHPLLSPSSPAFSLFHYQGLSQWVVSSHQEYWSFSISPSNDYSGLISFRMDWLDLLAVQGILKSLLKHQFHIQIISHGYYQRLCEL